MPIYSSSKVRTGHNYKNQPPDDNQHSTTYITIPISAGMSDWIRIEFQREQVKTLLISDTRLLGS